MQSTLNPQQADPHADPHDDVLVARIDEELSKLAHDAMRDPLDPQTHMGSDFPAGPAVPPVDTTFRPAAVNQGLRPSFGMRAIRTFVGFLLAVCVGVAGVVWQAYGDAAKQMIARWTPQFIATSSPPPENPGLPEQPNPPAVQANAAKAAPPQPAPPAQAAAEGVAPAAAAPESAVLLESMARELASARQEIDQLKASQEQMSREMARRHIRPRKPPQLPCCHRPPHLTCRGNLNHHRKPRPSRRPSQSFHRCRGRRCPCCASTGSFTENRRAKP